MADQEPDQGHRLAIPDVNLDRINAAVCKGFGFGTGGVQDRVRQIGIHVDADHNVDTACTVALLLQRNADQRHLYNRVLMRQSVVTPLDRHLSQFMHTAELIEKRLPLFMQDLLLGHVFIA